MSKIMTLMESKRIFRVLRIILLMYESVTLRRDSQKDFHCRSTVLMLSKCNSILCTVHVPFGFLSNEIATMYCRVIFL